MKPNRLHQEHLGISGEDIITTTQSVSKLLGCIKSPTSIILSRSVHICLLNCRLILSAVDLYERGDHVEPPQSPERFTVLWHLQGG